MRQLQQRNRAHIVKFAQPVAVSHSFSTTAVYSPALLALKRFARGVLKHFGIGAASLLVILSIGAYSSAGVLPDGGDFKAESFSSSAYVGHSQSRRVLPQTSQHSVQTSAETSEASAAMSQPFPGFRTRMLRHRLTGARLSVPDSREQSVTSLSAAE